VPLQGENDASVILRSDSEEESHVAITDVLHSRDSSLPPVAQNDGHQNQLAKVLDGVQNGTIFAKLWSEINPLNDTFRG
jgi:hypothetical protein